jgi:hypothetical protein
VGTLRFARLTQFSILFFKQLDRPLAVPFEGWRRFHRPTPGYPRPLRGRLTARQGLGTISQCISRVVLPPHVKAESTIGVIMLKMLTRTIPIGALLLSTAYAQPQPSIPVTPEVPPVFVPESTVLPVPVNGCVWAGRSFSEGAGFCIADKVMEICTAGKWSREAGSESCHGALGDTK